MRRALTAWVTDPGHRPTVEPHLVPLDEVTLHLPYEVADYVDFYASEHHATNVGKMFRPDGDALTPNWKHLPIGYHGRSGTIVVSGTDVVRPSGQRKAPTDPAPVFGPSVKLDIEAEVGFVVGTPSELGRPVALGDFEEHVFGLFLLNDWSARDIQAWEYVPLGPSSASPSPPPSPPGSPRWRPSTRPGSPRPPATSRSSPTWTTRTSTAPAASTCASPSPSTGRRWRSRPSPPCTGRPPSSSPT